MSLVKKREDFDPVIREWISKVVGEPLKEDVDLISQLKDGIILCKLINKLKPGSIPKINVGKLPFHKMENIGKYLEACKALGLGADKIFTTPALFEEKDPPLVRLNLYSLGMHVSKNLKGWTGPNIVPIKPPEQINIKEVESGKGSIVTDQSTESNPQVTGNAVADTMDLATKEALKFNPELEQAEREWIELVLGEKFPKPSFAESLKDGVLLCKLLNKIKAGTVQRINSTKLNKFKCMENLVYYIQACIGLGLPQDHIFDPADLFDEKNLNLVLTNIQTVGTVIAPKLAPQLPTLRTPSSTPSFYASLISTDELSPAEEQRVEELLSWVNGHLSKISLSVADIRDLIDGVKLIKLLELLTKQSVGTYHLHPYLPWHNMQNAILILRFIGEQAANAVRDCTKTDLLLGKAKPLASLLAFIREKFDNDFKFKEVAQNERTRKIAEEIRDTEATYVSMLSKVDEAILKPLHKAIAQNNDILTKDELYKIFCNLDKILALHKEVLGELESRLKTYSSSATILSDIWSKRKDTILSLYIEYVKNFDTVYSQLKYLKKKKKSNFKPIIKEFENEQKKTNALDLPSFLILPVQRIPRYMLLLTELDKYTEASHPDKKSLGKALDDVKEVLRILDSSKEDGNQRIVVIEKILDNMDFPLQLVHPEREFIREGVLRLDEDDERPYTFLFNDIMIYSEQRLNAGPNEKQFEVKQIIPFGFCEGVEKSEDANSFYLIMDDDKMKCTLGTEAERDGWMEDVRQQISKRLVIDFE
eukprot:TRINITY_DN2897_c0_g3_i1.p1 TRINITY_DN2897_c0_g3~~TRINITY_DN2897_c0_g3_i1.p1  ORF type:complete len:763 (+),score=183.21 TRINITY_DN2897_c0_g3_i1:412-2700(+)